MAVASKFLHVRLVRIFFPVIRPFPRQYTKYYLGQVLFTVKNLSYKSHMTNFSATAEKKKYKANEKRIYKIVLVNNYLLKRGL